ncbi:porin [Mangrovibacterium sp.]|uniref:porin n=1 Tax=Mangrovibacterium sp. TaxID=1961364 RepID=UPI003563FA98
MKTSVKFFIGFCVLLFTLASPSLGQSPEEKNSTFAFTKFQKDKAFSPIVGVQTWVTYSMGEEKNGTQYANRADASFRRLRLGAKGAPYAWLRYQFELHLDRLGEDPNASTKGSYSGLNIWKAFLTAKLTKNDLVHLHIGYYWTGVSLDYVTSPWSVSSFDKTRADWYLRNFVTGKGNGIESGFGLGGLKNFEGFGINYQVGAFLPQAFSGTENANPLFTGRFMFTFGDPEQKTYSIRHSGNHWNARNGVTIGLAGSTIGKVDNGNGTVFNSSNTYGADISACAGGLKIEGEYYKMKREATGFDDFSGTAWFVRCGYNIPVKETFVEPTFTIDKFDGEGETSLYSYIGDDITFDIGVNWYLNKTKLKLALHYLNQKGSASSNVGDYIGMAMQVRL